MDSADVIVIGGGLFGPAIAYGLAKRGMKVLVLDEGDDALRAARGNFGLVWVQSKGRGMQRYADWSRESAALYGAFAAELKELTGIDIAYRNAGGLQLLLGEEERARRACEIAEMRRQAGDAGFECEIVERAEVERLVPGLRLGKTVVGASFCPHDGDVNPLKLLRALYAALRLSGARILVEHRAEAIRREGSAFVVTTPRGAFAAPKVVLAAGHGITRLAPMVGLRAPIRPQRGQVLATERTRPLIPIPIATIRQTDEGTILLGSSEEEVGFDDGTTLEVTRRIATRAVAAFPELASLHLVRSWGCIRVLTPDRCAIYDESESHPGAFVATSHSGVTLAAVNAFRVAPWIAGEGAPPGFAAFAARRFAEKEGNVQAAL